MLDVVQKAEVYCGDLRAEILKVDEFLRFAEKLARMDDAERYLAPVQSIARITPLTRPVEVPAPRPATAVSTDLTDTTDLRTLETAGKINTDSLFRGAVEPAKRESGEA